MQKAPLKELGFGFSGESVPSIPLHSYILLPMALHTFRRKAVCFLSDGLAVIEFSQSRDSSSFLSSVNNHHQSGLATAEANAALQGYHGGKRGGMTFCYPIPYNTKKAH